MPFDCGLICQLVYNLALAIRTADRASHADCRDRMMPAGEFRHHHKIGADRDPNKNAGGNFEHGLLPSAKSLP